MADLNTINEPGKKAKKRPRGALNLILIVGIIAAIGLFVWAEQQRRATESRLEQTAAELESIRQNTQRGGEELAKEVLEKVKAHMVLPEEPAPTVATIVDIDRLKEANEFYGVAENGDHLIITDKRAILYDPDRNIILDVVPVRINQEEATGSPAASPQTSPRISPTGSPAGSPVASPTT